jgi:aldose 1-epimerase
MKISKKTFGVLANGKKVHLYTLKAGELSFSVMTLGATWTSLMVPSRSGRQDDVILGFSDFAGYCGRGGPTAITGGRFANRIGGASFPRDGHTYTLEKNDGENSLHGGWRGYDKLLWKAEAYKEKDGIFVRFELESPDGDGGYPGNLKVAVSYGLTKSNEVIATYEAKSDARTPVNLTNHAYFNLAGRGTIHAHDLQLNCSNILEVDKALIPSGKLIPVDGTPYDFRTSKPIGRDMDKAIQGGAPGGYDHCYTVDGEAGKLPGGSATEGCTKLRPCAELREKTSGRTMRILTTQPSVQLYTANNLREHAGKIGSVYNIHSGVCLETQHYPDSPNHPAFPDSIFGPARDYHEKAVFAFGW